MSHPTIFIAVLIVADSGWFAAAKAGLADSERCVAYVERVIGVNAGGKEVDAAPEEGGDDDHRFAGKTIAEPPGDRRGAHIGDHEPEGERPDLPVVKEKLLLYLLLDAGKDVAVYVVDEVQSGEEDEGGGGSGDGGSTAGFGRGCHLFCHLWGKDSR